MAQVPPLQALNYLDCKRRLMRDFPHVYSFTIDKILEVHNGHYEKAYRSLTYTMNEIRHRHPDFGKDVSKQSSYNHVMKLYNDKGESIFVSIHTMARPRHCVSAQVPLIPKQNVILIKKDGRTSKQNVIPVKKANSTPKQNVILVEEAGSTPKENVKPVQDFHEITKQKVIPVEEKIFPDQEADRCLALNLLEADYAETGQFIECVCCYNNCVFDNMAQCMEGHLVCVKCLNSYAIETVFGAGKVALGCMASECTAIYSEDDYRIKLQCLNGNCEYPKGVAKSELKRCLSKDTWSKLEERSLKENLNKAKVKDLVICPHCDFAAILSPRAKVFHCYRDSCNKDTCRDCGLDWTQHGGTECAKVETKDETSLRVEFEEKMTKAKVRMCVSCQTEFTKERGCNKMTCRCGATMCYICRTPDITYDHFCEHVRTPEKDCKTCNACNLWTNPEADDERALQEIRKEAKAKQVELGLANVKEIGTPAPSQ